MRRLAAFSLVALIGLLVFPALAQDDPTEVDAKHYTVVFENDAVRVLRIQYGPGEKSVMHYHPEAVAVALTDHHVKFEMPDGETMEANATAGEAWWTEAGEHLPQNLGDQPLELILVEMKE